jgi:hypothetical protein
MRNSIVLFSAGMWLLASVAFAAPAAPAPDPQPRTIAENEFERTLRGADCIVLYDNDSLSHDDEELQRVYGADAHGAAAKELGRLAGLVARTGLPVEVYRISWREFSDDHMQRIRADIASALDGTTPPTVFVLYRNGKPLKVKLPVRPDAEAAFVHKILEDFLPQVKKEGADYLEAGWLVTDVKKPYIHLVGERKATVPTPAGKQQVQIVTYTSALYQGDSSTFERIFLPNGRLLGSIESCGKYGKAGYFDYDSAGKMQYRVKYRMRADN